MTVTLTRYIVTNDGKYLQRLTDAHFQWVSGPACATRYATRGQAARDVDWYGVRDCVIRLVRDKIPYPESQWVSQ